MYGLYYLPGSNFAPFEDVKVQYQFQIVLIKKYKKSAPWRILEDLGKPVTVYMYIMLTRK